MVRSFAQRSPRSQVRILRERAYAAAAQFGLEPVAMRLINHGFNTTFAVRDRDGTRYALRLNVNSLHDEAGIRAEIAWVRAIQRDTDLRVPEPVTSLSGDDLVPVAVEGLSRSVFAVLYRWLEGADVADRVSPVILTAMGHAMKTLHEHASTWTLPAGTALEAYDTLLCGQPYQLGEDPVFREAYDLAEAIVRRLAQTPARVVHFDLHFHNVKYRRGQLAVFDFDDCMIAAPALDAAQSLFYVRRMPDAPDLEAAFWRGLGTTPEELGMSRAELETLLIGRQILLANDLQNSDNAELRAIAPGYTAKARSRVQAFLSTGRYDPSTPATS